MNSPHPTMFSFNWTGAALSTNPHVAVRACRAAPWRFPFGAAVPDALSDHHQESQAALFRACAMNALLSVPKFGILSVGENPAYKSGLARTRSRCSSVGGRAGFMIIGSSLHWTPRCRHIKTKGSLHPEEYSRQLCYCNLCCSSLCCACLRWISISRLRRFRSCPTRLTHGTILQRTCCVPDALPLIRARPPADVGTKSTNVCSQHSPLPMDWIATARQ